MSARPWLARTQLNYAGMLLRRNAPADHDRARDLLQQALAAARDLGMPQLAADCERLLATIA